MTVSYRLHGCISQTLFYTLCLKFYTPPPSIPFYPIKILSRLGIQFTRPLGKLFGMVDTLEKACVTGWLHFCFNFYPSGYRQANRALISPGPKLVDVLFQVRSISALGPTKPLIQGMPRALSRGMKRPGRKADHSP